VSEDCGAGEESYKNRILDGNTQSTSARCCPSSIGFVVVNSVRDFLFAWWWIIQPHVAFELTSMAFLGGEMCILC